jgi:hypothetical protein
VLELQYRGFGSLMLEVLWSAPRCRWERSPSGFFIAQCIDIVMAAKRRVIVFEIRRGIYPAWFPFVAIKDTMHEHVNMDDA